MKAGWDETVSWVRVLALRLTVLFAALVLTVKTVKWGKMVKTFRDCVVSVNFVMRFITRRWFMVVMVAVVVVVVTVVVVVVL